MLVEGKNVILVQDATDVDADGYRPRYVVTESAFVNYEVVRLGFASVVTTPPDETCRDALISAQVEAQTAVRGVWQASSAAHLDRGAIPNHHQHARAGHRHGVGPLRLPFALYLQFLQHPEPGAVVL